MRKRAETVVMFVGPTIAASARARELAKPYRLRPPVKRQDVAKVVEKSKPGVLVICDGVFHEALAVGHAEIRDAIRRGWRVWGLSSMGAIRAREMGPLGMRGFGQVFERFAADGDFQDDEVALLHEPTPPYRPITEPLVHLRAAIDHLTLRGVVGSPEARDVVAELKSRWYGERTVRATIDALARRGCNAPAVKRELADFRQFAMKTIDLERFLEERPWSHDAQ